MDFYLLDAGGIGLVIGFLVIFIILAILLEGVTLLLLKYNPAGKSFLDAFVINIASLAVGYLITTVSSNGLDFTTNEYLDFFLVFLITVVVEFVVLYLLNLKKPARKTVVAAIAVNLVSYLLLILFKFVITG